MKKACLEMNDVIGFKTVFFILGAVDTDIRARYNIAVISEELQDTGMAGTGNRMQNPSGGGVNGRKGIFFGWRSKQNLQYIKKGIAVL
jgi:hypothetical protein